MGLRINTDINLLSPAAVEFFEVVESRRSIRRFKRVKIPEEDVRRIMEAGNAPFSFWPDEGGSRARKALGSPGWGSGR
jgi:hypothetical protein